VVIKIENFTYPFSILIFLIIDLATVLTCRNTVNNTIEKEAF
jgi:hypothetical protein